MDVTEGIVCKIVCTLWILYEYAHVLEIYVGMYISYRKLGLVSLTSLNAYLSVYVCTVHVSENVLSIEVEADFHVLTRIWSMMER